MFGYNSESAFFSIVERNLKDVPQGITKGRIIELGTFLSNFLIKNDPQTAIAMLAHDVQLSSKDTAVSQSTSDMEVFFYLKLVLLSDDSNSSKTLQYLQQIKGIMENKLVESLSKDSVVKKAQELFFCDNIQQLLKTIPMHEKPEIASLINFFAEASKESGDAEFSSSLEIIARVLLMPA